MPDNLGAIRRSHHRTQKQLAVLDLSVCPDRHLASATQSIQRRAFATGGSARFAIVQKREQRESASVALANLDGQCPLSGRRTHLIDRKISAHEFGSLQPF